MNRRVVPLTVGAILAGGLSRRMGGSPKALLELGGRPVLARIAERLAPQCAALILNGEPALAEQAGIAVSACVPDDVPGRSGPLAGILRALDWAATHRRHIRWVATTPCDTPFLPSDLVLRLHAAREASGAVLAIAASNGRTHPVCGLWDVALRDDIRRSIETGDIRVGRFADTHGAAVVTWDGGGTDPFLNLNTPDDLATANHLLAQL